MNFLPYEDVPLFLSVEGKSGEFIFAETASLSVNQKLEEHRQLDDNIFQICSNNEGSSMSYVPHDFVANSDKIVCLGPSGGPPKPLATSIYKIPSGTKITFPNSKHLYFSEDIFPNGHNYTASVYSKSGSFNLSQEEAQSGYFEPIFNYSTQSPVQGKLDVNFYVDTGNLKNFFNITGLSDPTLYPPIDEEKITGFLGEFEFTDAYLNAFNFSLSLNSISQASASFNVYGALKHKPHLLNNYYQSKNYSQSSIAHGQESNILGASEHGIDNPISFSYSIAVDRKASYAMPTGDQSSLEGNVPIRVSKRSTAVVMSLEGESINPDILIDGFNGKRANLSVNLSDLNYDAFEDNSAGFLHQFNCSGVINSQSLSVQSDGYLNGAITVYQSLK